ncbi:MAG: Ig-like domain-containing protein [Clostridiaceae bacterium]|jgi:hypothetical protein|nr:Ig-like domain-containing protein [Clostridiaceae bacterium]
MRKLLIAILILIPVLIVGILSATAKYISAAVQIPVEKITLKYNGESTDSAVVYVGEEGKLTAEVLPFHASNKRVVFSVANLNGEDAGPLSLRVEINPDTGEIRFTDIGEITVCCTSEDGGLKAFIQFYAARQTVERIAAELPGTVYAGDTFRLNATVEPRDAENKNINFMNDTPHIAEVDRNGIVFAKKPGTARFTLRAAQNDSVSTGVTIKILPPSPERLFYKATVISASARLDLTPYLATDASVSLEITPADAAEIHGNELIFKGSGVPVTVAANGFIGSNFIFLPENRDVEILNKALLPDTATAGGRTLYIPGAYVAASVYGKISYSSSNPAIASVSEDGRVTVLSDGTVTLRAYDTVSGAYDEITVTAAQEILWARLNLNDYTDSLAGIKGETVYGTEKFYQGSLTASLKHLLYFTDVYPKQSLDGLNSKFIWSSSDEAAATVSRGEVTVYDLPDNGFNENKKVTITAVPKYPAYENLHLEFSYTYTLNGGIDVFDFDGFSYAVGYGRTVNMRTDIEAFLPDNLTSAGKTIITLKSNLNGNGYILKGGRALAESNDNTDFIAAVADGITIDNVTLRGADFDGEVADLERFENFARLLKITSEDGSRAVKNITLKNCLLENASMGLSAIRCDDINIFGCVFRNLFREGISIQNRSIENVYKGINLNLKNVVFYDCFLLPILSEPNTDKKTFEIQNNINVYGFLKVYGWRAVEDIPVDRLLNGLKEFPGMGSLFGNSIREMLASNKKYAVKKDGKNYYLFGATQIGITLGNTDLIKEIMHVRFFDDDHWEEMRATGKLAGLGGIQATAGVWTLPPGSDYIGFHDTFGANDRDAMREL